MRPIARSSGNGCERWGCPRGRPSGRRRTRRAHGARGAAGRWSRCGAGATPAGVLRGERDEPRDRALAWVAERVREGGGLSGGKHARWPVRRIEWAIAALLLGTAAGGLWPRRTWAAAAILAIGCAAV